jgi:hypothetical protein
MVGPTGDEIGVSITGSATGLVGSLKTATTVIEESTATWNAAFAGVGATIEAVLAPLIAFTAAFEVFRELKETVHQTVELAQSLKIMSEKTGIGVEELSALRYAAKLSEVEVGTLSLGLQRLARAMEETGKGAKGPAAEAFRDLGVHASTANGQLRPFRDVLLDLADKFESMPDGPRKAALAMDLFGRSGTDLIPFLNRGKQGIAELEAEARRLGVTMSEKDVAAALEYEEATKRLDAVWQTFKRNIVVELLPALEFMIEAFTAGIHLLEAWFQVVQIMLAPTIALVHAIMAVGYALTGNFAAAADQAKASWSTLTGVVDHAKKAFEDVKKAIDDFTVRKPVQAQGDDSSAPAVVLRDTMSQMEKWRLELAQIMRFYSAGGNEASALAAERNFWEEKVNTTKKGTKDYLEALEHFNSANKAMWDFIRRTNRENEKKTIADWESVFGGMTTAFKNAMSQMIQAGGGFRDFMRDLWYDLVAEAIAGEVKILSVHLATWLTRRGITRAGFLEEIALATWAGIKWIGIEAAKAAASAWAAMVGVPFIGPVLAPAVALGTLAAVLALAGNLRSAAGGFDVPAGLNPVTQLHGGEMVLPKKYADVVRGMAGGGSGGGTINVYAMDSSDVKAFMMKHRGPFSDAVAQAVKDGTLTPKKMGMA